MDRIVVQSKLPAILLIEKDNVTLELYQRELCKSFEVLCFTEVDGVMEVMANRGIRAVIIEPEIDSGQGWKLIHAIDAAFPDRSIPVIVCSTRDIYAAQLPKSVTKHLIKPVLPRELREKTLEVLRKRSQVKDHD